MSGKSDDVFEPDRPVVPEGWDIVPFTQAAQVVSDQGKRIKQSAYLPSGKIPVIDQGQDYIGGYTDDEGMVIDGELPVVLFGDHTRSIKYVDKPFAVGAEGVKVLKPMQGFEPKYFYYLLRSLRIPSRGYSRHFQFLKKFHLPRAPEDQQKHIVAEIEKQFSRLDEAVASLKRVKANLKRYKAAVLKAAVEGKLTEAWRKQHPDTEPASELLQRILVERRAKWEQAELAKMQAMGKIPKDDTWKKKYSEPTNLDTTELPELPTGWAWATLDMIGQEGRPIIYGIIKPGPHVPDGVPYVRVTEMKDGRIDVEGLRRTAPERAAKFARATLQPGDILISKDGTIGRVAVVPPELAGGNITQHVMRAPVHEWVWRDFVVWAIRSDWCQRWLTGETKGVALRGVNVEDFRRLPIPIPPVAEQISIDEEVERCLSITDEAEAQVNANLQRAERLRQSILATAFTPPVKEFAEPTLYANREQRAAS